MKKGGAKKFNSIELSFNRKSADDYEFTLGGVVFYVDKKVREANYFVTFQAIDELEAERKKVAALEKKIAELIIKNSYLEAQIAG